MSDDGNIVNHLFIDPGNLEELFRTKVKPFQVMGDYSCYFIDRRFVDDYVLYVSHQKIKPTYCVLHPGETTEHLSSFCTSEFSLFGVDDYKVTNKVYYLVITFPTCLMKTADEEIFNVLYSKILTVMRAKFN